jgi:hypothetical protein
MTGLLLISQTLLHNYTCTQPTQPLRSLTSTNAGLLCTLFLSSRLEIHAQRFGFIFLGLFVFAMLPLVIVRVRLHAPSVYVALGIVLPLVTCVWLYVYCMAHAPAYSWTTIAFAVSILLVNLVAPMLLYHMQHLRNVMTGQWSEVIIEQT